MSGAAKEQWSGRRWTITLEDDSFVIDHQGGTTRITPTKTSPLTTKRVWFRKFLFQGSTRLVRLSGLSRQEVRHLLIALEISHAVKWAQLFTQHVDFRKEIQRWIPQHIVDELCDNQPDRRLKYRVQNADIDELLSETEHDAVDLTAIDVADHIKHENEQILKKELVSQKQFFDSIERQPLTLEQSTAVITFDNRVQLVAAAGSGKTSVMVARAAYAVQRGFVKPERILLLAFNKAAAEELQHRVQERFENAGLDATNVKASTFHKFGLDVIGKSTGARPRPAPWLESGRDLHVLEEIVDELRDASEDFRFKWDLFRLIFADRPTTGPEDGETDSWDKDKRSRVIETVDGGHVSSHGERMIANWLYFNGVEYKYERPYSYPTATAEHSQYHPDFFYPKANLWHEHWAIDQHGNIPDEFQPEYGLGIEWKKATHEQNGTKLIETTWGDVVFGNGLETLEAALREHRIATDWNPDRPIKSGKIVTHEDLCRLIRTFMTHVKSGKLERADLQQRLETTHKAMSGGRTDIFLEIYWPIHDEWNRRLREENYVDFEDMLSIAADIAEQEHYESSYDLILVDEFQDASQARARLVRGLIQQPNTYLLAVGDDWQSVNRFAGADMSVMTHFHDWYGPGPKLELTTTFRCTQRICDVSSVFVRKNPTQLQKRVTSIHKGYAKPVEIIRHKDTREAISEFLSTLSADVESGHIESATKSVSVDVLGRFRHDSELMPTKVPKNLKVTFRTAHSSKGLEADFVVIANGNSGLYGFPSGVTDDPILDLAMATADNFEHSEERRLFYVALTRARKQVVIITTPGNESQFVTELMTNHDVLVTKADGEEDVDIKVCPACQKGTLVEREGPHGKFLGCSQFPACEGPRKPRNSNPKQTARPCPECGKGTLERRNGRYGAFFGCSRYPTCRATTNN